MYKRIPRSHREAMRQRLIRNYADSFSGASKCTKGFLGLAEKRLHKDLNVTGENVWNTLNKLERL